VYGQIKCFILVGSTPLVVIRKACPEAIISEKFCTPVTLLDKTAIPVCMLDSYDVVGINLILEKCIFVQVSSDECYIIRFPNSLSYD
jgi:hypothetical protein